MHIILSLFGYLILGASVQAGLSGSKESHLNNQFKKINKYLVDHGDANDNTESLLNKAAIWLQEEKSGSHSGSSLIQALNLFVSLKDIKCDEKSYENLRESQDEVMKHFNYKDTVFKIWVDVAMRYSKDCQHTHEETFNTLSEQLDKTKIGYVNTFTKFYVDQAISSSKEANNRMIPNLKVSDAQVNREVVLNPIFINLYEYGNQGKNIRPALEALAAEDPDWEYLKDETNTNLKKRSNKYLSLTQKYFMEPCEYFVDELGPTVFEPALFGALTLSGRGDHIDDIEELNEFHRSWISYQICKDLLKQKHAALNLSYLIYKLDPLTIEKLSIGQE